jgi:hypothetical protein
MYEQKLDVQTMQNTCHCPIYSNLRNFQLRKHISYKCPITFLQNRELVSPQVSTDLVLTVFKDFLGQLNQLVLQHHVLHCFP